MSLTFRPLANEPDLRELYDFDEGSYSDAGISWNRFVGWWRAFPAGRLAVFEDGRLCGAAGIWPLLAPAYDALVAGELPEHRLNPAEHFALIVDGNATWYLSGVLIAKACRNAGRAAALATEIMQHARRLARLPHLHVASIAVSPDHERILRKFGFLPTGASLGGYYIFENRS